MFTTIYVGLCFLVMNTNK